MPLADKQEAFLPMVQGSALAANGRTARANAAPACEGSTAFRTRSGGRERKHSSDGMEL